MIIILDTDLSRLIGGKEKELVKNKILFNCKLESLMPNDPILKQENSVLVTHSQGPFLKYGHNFVLMPHDAMTLFTIPGTKITIFYDFYLMYKALLVMRNIQNS